MMFGLTVRDIRKLAYDLVVKLNAEHPFNKESKLAGSDWVQSFILSHNLKLRQPQATCISRAAGFNKSEVSNIFDLYKELLEKYQSPNTTPAPPARIYISGMQTKC